MVERLKMAGEHEIEHLAQLPRDRVNVPHGLEREMLALVEVR